MTETNQTFHKELPIPLKKEIRRAFSNLSPFELLLFWVFLGVCILSAGVLLNRANTILLTEIPAKGGSITEGVIGTPRFINPLLATSNSDRDLTSLVYSGLMRATATGDLLPDLAEKYEVSDDGRTYTFTLRETALFHDGTKVTADDIIFTVLMTQDPELKSPRRASWEGVMSEKIDDRTVRFILPQPYAPFLENTTLGILPRHLWDTVSALQFPFSQLNVDPIGSGPFSINTIRRNSSGLPTTYELTAFSDFTLGEPHISSLILKFYPNEEELIQAQQDNEVDAINSIAPNRARALSNLGVRIETSPLPRIFGVFFNQNQASIFTNKVVRRALSLSVPEEKILEEVLKGYATIIDSPIPPGLLLQDILDTEKESRDVRLEKAREMLRDAGWEREEETGTLVKETKKSTERLSFSLATSNAPELKAIAILLKEAWNEIGVEVKVKFFETSDLNQNVIRARRYDALLFGEIIGRELDLFSFWHSSQRNDPGLNIALYANITADKLLSDARANINRAEREILYREFVEELKNDIPALFLYSPDFIYVVPKKVKAIRLGSITTSGERFLNIHEWYIETEYVWPFFIEK